MSLHVSKPTYEPPSNNCDFHKRPTGKYSVHCPSKFTYTKTHWETHVPYHNKLESDIFALQQQQQQRQQQ